MNRRQFATLLPALGLASKLQATGTQANPYPISANAYNWFTFYRREGKEWGKNWDECIAHFAQTGIKALEPIIENIESGKILIAALKKNGILMPSLYVNSWLHEEAKVASSIKGILDIAALAKTYGTSIIVTNPSPISWGGDTLKTDAELRTQAKALETLGKKLKAMGLTLAYHTHDMEMKAGAREFHHMMQNTTAANMSFCFDLHWVYRGSQNSENAVFDVLKMYGHRIVELHVRQSTNGIWNEEFSSKGDIDYARVAIELSKLKKKPLLCLEQCLETQSPNSLTVVEAQQKGAAMLKNTFKVS
jgi:inosose dehydratase